VVFHTKYQSTVQAIRVYQYQKTTIHSACEIMSAIGVKKPSELHPSHIMVRTSGVHTATYAERFPPVEKGALLKGTGPPLLQEQFNMGKLVNANGGKLPVISRSHRNALEYAGYPGSGH
jgi:hypothetical protein